MNIKIWSLTLQFWMLARASAIVVLIFHIPHAQAASDTARVEVVTPISTIGDVNSGFNAYLTFRSHIWAFLVSPAGTIAELFSSAVLGKIDFDIFPGYPYLQRISSTDEIPLHRFG